VDKIAACPPRYGEQVEDLARQMLADPRARQGLEAFFRWWLNLDAVARLKLPAGYPPALIESIAAEPARFGVHVVFDDGGKFDTLLRAPYSLLDESLAPLYGVPVTGPAFTRVALDPTQRMGLLTQPGVLIQGGAGEPDTHPTARGRFIRARILCQELPDHPPGVDPEPQRPEQTKRDWLTAVTAHPSCLPCHREMDPLGLAFEHYDGIGRHRADDRGHPIDDTGALTGMDPQGSFTGALALIELLVNSQLPARCFPLKVLEYATGRRLPEREYAQAEYLGSRFVAEGGDIRWLMAHLTGTKQFLGP
jgi:hypothetical protein